LENNSDLMNKTVLVLAAPKVERLGTTKIIFKNFNEICKSLKRDLDHVFQYFLVELDATGSLDSTNRFIIKGKFGPKQVEAILVNYIKDYVTCKMCLCLDTQLVRSPITRITFIVCNLCHADSSIVTIKKGFHATINKQ